MKQPKGNKEEANSKDKENGKRYWIRNIAKKNN